ncbi:hypothetical protein BD560DRAFT_196342 [Blakeslea trispora]|nr:hypothetical protein BD560DRAFT_196342 [Blakeslea trispora]
MSNEFLSRNRMSTLSTGSYSSSHSNSSHDHCYDQSIIGRDFASTIVVADLAIRSSTYMPTSQSATTSAEEREAEKKDKRRVTFNLDNIQIQTIPSYYSSSSNVSSSDASLEDNTSDEEEQEKQEEQQVEIAPAASSSAPSERISKKESYNALQQRMQTRRGNQSHIRPGYWYPSRSLNGTMMIRQQPLPALRSIEMTEQLIAESIQREMASNPHLLQQVPRNFYSSSSSSILLTERGTDGDDEEEEEEEESQFNQLRFGHLDDQMSHYSPLRLIDDDDDASDDEEAEDAAAQNAIMPFPEYVRPQLPLSSTGGFTEPAEPESVCIECHNENDDEKPTICYFFIKVLRAENLDFPIEKDTTGVCCTIRYKDMSNKSPEQLLKHNIQFDHEVRIDNIEMQEQIAITIHATCSRRTTGSNWYHKIKSSSDLNRYIHEKDGSLGQTLLPINQSIPGENTENTVALLLTNNWYRTQTEASSFFKKTSTIIKKKSLHITPQEKGVGKIVVRCLAIKVCRETDYVPQDMDEAIEALNARRFYQTQWQAGYMTQFGGNAKVKKNVFHINWRHPVCQHRRTIFA